MAGTDSDQSQSTAPDEAFALLSDETRISIIRTLGEADGPLRFSELFDRIEYSDSSNFGYHLEKLTGHFVQCTDEGYILGQPGRRILEAVLSGAVTDLPVQESAQIDRECPYCSARIEITYQQERLELHCPECPGMERRPSTEGGVFQEGGNLGHFILPPAGLKDRSAGETLRAAEIWTGTETHALVRGVCRRCSAPLNQTVAACEDHDAVTGLCECCDQRFGAMFRSECTNCIFEMQAPIVTYLAGQPDLIEFMMNQGIGPLSPEAFIFPLRTVEEEILSLEPFSANYTFTTEGDTLTLAVDDTLSVSKVD